LVRFEDIKKNLSLLVRTYANVEYFAKLRSEVHHVNQGLVEEMLKFEGE
jgi:hypothetical protein